MIFIVKDEHNEQRDKVRSTGVNPWLTLTFLLDDR